jgi:hypothetical protein
VAVVGDRCGGVGGGGQVPDSWLAVCGGARYPVPGWRSAGVPGTWMAGMQNWRCFARVSAWHQGVVECSGGGVANKT